MNFKEALNVAEEKLILSGIDKKIAKQDAEEILLHTFKISKASLIIKLKEEIPETHKVMFEKSILERCNHKPIQYITNNAIFCGYSFFVNESCLIPRVDSEIIIEKAIKYITNSKIFEEKKIINILDVCAGSGCLGISLVNMLKDNKKFKTHEINLSLIDKSSMAMQIAKINCKKFNINAKYIISDILVNGLGNEQYDIILCNPPYIETNAIANLDIDVKNFEPHIALDGGEDGLTFYKSLSHNIKKNIHKHSIILFEIGYNQKQKVEEIYKKCNFNVEVFKDYANNDRCLILQQND